MTTRFAVACVLSLIWSGCVAPAEQAETPAVTATIAYAETWALTANEAQIDGDAYGLGIGSDANCVALQGDGNLSIFGGNVTISWDALAPTYAELHVSVLHENGTMSPRIEGPSPLHLALPPVVLADGEAARIYVGALRSGQIVAKQPVGALIEFNYVGGLHPYTLGCTVAG